MPSSVSFGFLGPSAWNGGNSRFVFQLKIIGLSYSDVLNSLGNLIEYSSCFGNVVGDDWS